MTKPTNFSLVIHCLIFFLPFPGSVLKASGTVAEDSAKAYQLLAETAQIQNADSLISLYEEIGGLFKKANMPLHWTEIQLLISDSYADRLEDKRKATHFLRKKLTQADWLDHPAHQAKLRLNLAYYESISGQILDARKNYEKVRNYYENQKDTVQLFYVYDPLGNIYSRLGEYEKARRLLSMSLNLRLKHRAYRLAAETCVNLGTSYFLTGDYRQAKKMYQQGLNLPEISSLSKGPLLAKIAEIYLKEKAYSHAIQASLEANRLLMGVEESSEDYYLTPVLIHNYQVLAQAYVQQNHLQKGIDYGEKALEIALQYYQTTTHREIAKIYQQMGDIYLSQQSLDKADQYYQQALQSVIPGFKPQNTRTYPSPEDYYPENTIMTVLARKGKLYWQKYQQTGDTSLWSLSLQGYRESLEVADTLRSIYRYESSSLQLQAEIEEIIAQILNITYQIYQETRQPFYAELALKMAEKNKAIVLQEAIQKAEARQNTGVPTYLIKHLHNLRNSLAEQKRKKFHLETQANNSTDLLMSEVNQQIFQLQESIDSLTIVLEDSFPTYRQLAQNTSETDLAELQNHLQNTNAVMVEYFTGPDHVFVIGLNGEEIQFHKLAISSQELAVQLHTFLPLLYNGRNFIDELTAKETKLAYTQLAFNLYESLLKPILSNWPPKEQKRLIIIPDGLLAKLNFDVLLTTLPAEKTSFYTYPYLLKDYIIRYESAATFLFKSEKKRASKSFIGYAPAYESNWLSDNMIPELNASRNGFGPLNYTSKEVKNIQQLMGGDIYLEQAASEKHFLAHASDYQVIHLAMHAFTNDQSPLYSGLIFSQFSDQQTSTLSDGTTDNILMAYEIYNQRLKADLAVLSACKTGLGQIAKGEGIMNLARAFRYAGCQNIVMSLWEADDYSTRFIMESFYGHLKAGIPKDEALHLAKTDFLNHAESDKAPPAFWATFVLIGNDQPLNLTPPLWEKGIYASLFLILLILLIARYRHKNLS
jgi:CHAT domain-containing protein